VSYFFLNVDSEHYSVYEYKTEVTSWVWIKTYKVIVQIN